MQCSFQQIGLPLDYTKVPLLCVLEPFLSANHLIVTPYVRIHVLDRSTNFRAAESLY